MSEGFGTLTLLWALVGPTPPVQRPKSGAPPIQRPQRSRPTQAESEPRPNDYKEIVSRGSVRLGGGFDVFIGRNVSFGPRFDVTIGFGGRVCVEAATAAGTPVGELDPRTCYDVRNIEETARIYSQELPVPVFIGAQLRITIPSPGA